MKIFLAGGEARHWIIESSPVKENADIFGGLHLSKAGGLYDQAIYEHRPYVLESFFYADEDTERLLKFYGDFLLDSGAFTFCAGKDFSSKNFEEYIERYADFINRNRVEKFFELDVESITGYDKVLEYRRKLERLTKWFGQLFDDYVFVFLAFAPFGISEIENPWAAILTVPLISAIVETIIEAIVTPASKKICDIVKAE